MPLDAGLLSLDRGGLRSWGREYPIVLPPSKPKPYDEEPKDLAWAVSVLTDGPGIVDSGDNTGGEPAEGEGGRSQVVDVDRSLEGSSAVAGWP